MNSIHFEGFERRINKVNECLKKYGFSSLEDAKNFKSPEINLKEDKFVKS